MKNLRHVNFPFWPLVLGICSLVLCANPLSAQTNSQKTIANRYLFIVDTSRAMQPRADGVLRAVQDLLASGMNGQLQPGDTVGLWTFNEGLYAGRFPLQKWSPAAQPEITLRVVNFLKGQKYEKQGSLAKVLPAMDRVLKGSPFITVILISDGDEKMVNTPFDNPINAFYKQWRDPQRKARMPFVTVLRATSGTITHHTVNSAPWKIELPPLPLEIQLAIAERNEPVKVSPGLKTSTVPNLIVSGRKLKPEPDPTVPVNLSGAGGPPATGSETTSTPETAKPEAPSAEPIPAPTPNPPAPAEPANLGGAGVPPAPRPKPAAVEPSKPAPAQTAAAVPPKGVYGWKVFAAAGLTLAAVVFGVTYLLQRRSRAVPKISIITRSLERDKD